MKKLRAIDLCCGAGGWSVAARGLPIEIVYAYDRDPVALQTHQLNHPETLTVECDLAQTDPAAFAPDRSIGPVDLILGAIPCEWLSPFRKISARSQVTESERDDGRQLLDNILAIVAAADPAYWCLEDVVPLIRELPPMTPYFVLDSRSFSGQRRKRVYVGNAPQPASAQDPRVLAAYLRPGPYRIGKRAFPKTPATNRTHTADKILAAYPDRIAPTVAGFGSRRDAEIALVDDQLPGGKRQIEWQEFATLQGFPADYLFYGSPTDVAKHVGQAVQIDTARAILTAIVDDWTDAGSPPSARRSPLTEAAP